MDNWDSYYCSSLVELVGLASWMAGTSPTRVPPSKDLAHFLTDPDQNFAQNRQLVGWWLVAAAGDNPDWYGATIHIQGKKKSMAQHQASPDQACVPLGAC